MFFKKGSEEASSVAGTSVANPNRSGVTKMFAAANGSSALQSGPGKSPFEGFNGQGTVLVGKGTKTTGEIRDATVIEIQGDFEGNVSANAVIVREGATFKGNILAEFVEAHGLIEGAIIAEQLLDIRATGLITAEVRYGQLCVATGGRLSGNLQTQTIEGTTNAAVPEQVGMPASGNVVPLQAG